MIRVRGKRAGPALDELDITLTYPLSPLSARAVHFRSSTSRQPNLSSLLFLPLNERASRDANAFEVRRVKSSVENEKRSTLPSNNSSNILFTIANDRFSSRATFIRRVVVQFVAVVAEPGGIKEKSEIIGG